MHGGDFEYKLIWIVEETGRGGVSAMVKKELTKRVIEVKKSIL